MKKIISILTLLIFILSLISFVSATSFTPIFCNDYEFTCCNEDKGPKQFKIKEQYQSMLCPTNALYCEVTDITTEIAGSNNYYVGSVNCQYKNPWYSTPFWQCDDERKVSTTSYRLEPGQQIYPDRVSIGSTSMQYNIQGVWPILHFTGTAASTTGIPVLGADGCKFNPINNKVYTTTSSLYGLRQVSSYTVSPDNCILAFQSGNRHICGYKEESCSYDQDCGGHTYGNKECNGRTLQTYGCRTYGSKLPLERDVGPFDSMFEITPSQPTTGNADFGKRCEIVSSKTVQCCGDTDCGTNYFCDINDFTCKRNVQCTYDYDCGVSEQCDYISKKLKTPVCQAGTCDFLEVSVQCCNNDNCAQNEYCDSNYQCQVSQQNLLPCNAECCVGKPGYVDKPCPIGEVCCGDGSCAVSISQCGNEGVTESIAMNNCADGIDNDNDNLIDNEDPGCLNCVIEGQQYAYDAKDCCQAQDGRFVPGKQPPWYQFWEESVPDKCLKQSTPMLIIGGLLLLAAIILSIFMPVNLTLWIIIAVVAAIIALIGFIGFQI